MRQIEESKSQLGKDAMFVLCHLYVVLLVEFLLFTSMEINLINDRVIKVIPRIMVNIIFNTKIASMKLQNKVPTRVKNKKFILKCVYFPVCVRFFELLSGSQTPVP